MSRKFKAKSKTEKALAEEHKLKSKRKVNEWHRMKKIEAEDKMARLVELRKELDQRFDALSDKEKPKEIKNGINFSDWLKKKNEDLIAFQKNQKNQKKKLSRYPKVDYSWIQADPSKQKLLKLKPSSKSDPLNYEHKNFWGTTIIVTSCEFGK